MEAAIAAILGGLTPSVAAWIALRSPSIRGWANHKSPSYMIIVATLATAFAMSIVFVVYLEYLRRREIVILNHFQMYSQNAIAVAIAGRTAGDLGKCVHEAQVSEKIAKDRFSDVASDKLSYRINHLFP